MGGCRVDGWDQCTLDPLSYPNPILGGVTLVHRRTLLWLKLRHSNVFILNFPINLFINNVS
jgi:hypothetical protein